MRYKIIKFGDRDGNGAIVQASGFFSCDDMDGK